MYYGVEAHVVFVGKRDFCTLVVWQVGRRILGQLVLVLSGQLCVGSGGLVLKMVDPAVKCFVTRLLMWRLRY